MTYAIVDTHDAESVEEVIRERLKEAARTERSLPSSRLKPADDGNAWPTPTSYTREDIEGWTEQERADFAEGRRRPIATPAQVSRYEDVVWWIIDHVELDANRRAVWAWARAQAKTGPTMKAWCRRQGLEEHTGKRRADRAVAQLCAAIGNGLDLLGDFGNEGVFTDPPEYGIETAMLGRGADDAQTPRFWHCPEPVDLSDPEQVAAIESALDRHNDRVDRAREARKRARLAKLEKDEAI